MNREALEATLEALGLEPRFQALRQVALSLAAAVDADPANASLWREYRGSIRDVMEATDGGNDAFAELLERFSEVGDPID